MQKKIDQEQAEMTAYEEVQNKSKGSGLVNEQFFYGQQMNKFPTFKQQEKAKEMVQEEIRR